MLALACAGGTHRESQPVPPACAAVFDLHATYVSEMVVERMRPKMVGPAKGSVRMWVEITPAGRLVEATVEESPSPEIAALAIEAAAEAEPFPPLRSPCIRTQRHSLRLFYDVPLDCGSDEVEAYLAGIRSQLFAEQPFRTLTPGSERIQLRLSERGEIRSTEPPATMDAETYASLSAGLERLSPFPAPPAHLRECLVDRPVWLLLVVP